MSWTKIDDGILTHPKMAEAEEICPVFAWVLWSKALVYVNQHKLDGRVTRKIATRLVGAANAGPAIAALVESALWDEAEDGWLFHDFHEHSATKEARAEKAKKNADNQAAYRERQRLERETAASAGRTSGEASRAASKPPTSETVSAYGSESDVASIDPVSAYGKERKAPPSLATPLRSEPSRAENPAAAPAGLARSEQAVLDALATWPALEPLATPDMVRQIQATAAPAGWSPDDVLAGIADLGAKQGMASAAAGSLDAGKLATKLAGFIKSAHLVRRSGGKEAPVAHGGYPGRPPTVEAPSLASQMPFTRAPREAS